MKRRITLFLICFLISVLWFQAPAQASCFNPAGNAGDIVYSQQWRTIQYCNGGNWFSTGLRQYAAQGVYFDGDGADEYLNLGAAAAPSSAQAAGSFWFRRVQTQSVAQTIFRVNKSTTVSAANLRFLIELNAGNQLHVSGQSSTPTTILDAVTTNTITDRNWHHLAYAIDLTQSAAGCDPAVLMYLDGVKQTFSGTPVCTNASIAFTPSSGPNTSIGAASNGSNPYNGALADFWFESGTYIDLRTASNLALFYNTATNGAVYLGSNGSLPTGAAVPIFMTGPPHTWANNTGGTIGGFGNPDATPAYTTAGTTAELPYMAGNLVGYWPLEDTASGGNYLVDDQTSNNTNDGGTNGTYIDGGGKIGDAMSFDGSTQYVNYTDWAAVRLAGSWSVSAWFKLSALPTTGNFFSVMRRVDSAGADNYDLTIDNGSIGAGMGLAVFFNTHAAPSTNRYAKYAFTPSVGTWYHLTGVYDSSGQTLTLYLNGAQVATQSVTGFSPAGTIAGEFIIGLGTVNFPGTIDDVRVYNTNLSAAQVLALYNRTVCAGPLGTAGDFMYNGSTNHVYQYCDGAAWQPMGPVPGAGGSGCTTPVRNEGDIIYSSANHVMQYCDGTNWDALGGIVPVGNGLVGWWNFDEGSGTTANDSSGNGNTGTLVNTPTWTTAGKINGALTFNGTTQYVQGADAASLDLSGSWTAAAWVRLSATPGSGANMTVLDKETSSGSNFQLAVDNGQISAGLGWVINYNSTGCCDNRYAKYVTGISTGVWYHLAGVYDSVAKTLTLYLNGVSVASFNATGFPPEGGTGGPFYVGGQGTQNYAAGTIDDARVYNRALSASEIWRLYNGAP